MARTRSVGIATLALTAVLAGGASADAAQWTPAGSFGSLASPVRIDVAADGSLWVVENNVHAVRKYTPDGTQLLSIGKFGTAPGEFNSPSAIAVAPNGDIYVTDVGGNRVQHFTDGGTLVGTFGTGGRGPGEFENPLGIAVDASGAVYVADVFNGRLQKFSASGEYLETIGAPFQFGAPYGVEVDPDGNLWVTDHNGAVRKITPGGTVLQELSGFGQPTNVVVDGSGQAHIVNWDRNRIETYSPSGTLVDQLQFDAYVHSIALGRNGRLYATMPHIGQVRSFTPPVPADTDDDGIPDAIDVDPGTASSAFRDAAGHNGSVVSNPGLTVTFVDLPDPDGVKIVVSGPSTARATLQLCVPPGGGTGFTTRVSGGSEIDVFCGSVKLHVVSGAADVVLGTTTVAMREGVTGKVTDNGDGSFAVQNFGGGDITITAGGRTTSVSAGDRLAALDVTAPELTVPESPVNLKPTGSDGVTYGTAAGYPGVSATDNRTAAATVSCTPAAPHTFALGSDTTVTCIAKDEAGLTTTRTFTVHVGVTASALCARTTALVGGSARARTLTASQREAMAKRTSTAACAALDRLTARMTAAQKTVIVALYGRSVDALAADGWLLGTQATSLKTLAGQL